MGPVGEGRKRKNHSPPNPARSEASSANKNAPSAVKAEGHDVSMSALSGAVGAVRCVEGISCGW